ncbi:MAG: heavy metal-responsive transcriptional regulator [Methylococcus sp.]|nr:MAG: heavy metal-responsive transcriptional regulator [Methylococcus sp.]
MYRDDPIHNVQVIIMSERYLRIGQLANELGTTTKTLRFYEEIGLLDESTRSSSGYRLYDRKHVTNARLLIDLRRMGLNIDELKAFSSATNGDSLRQRLLALMDRKIGEMDLSLSVLQGRRDDLAARQQALLLTPRGRPADCVCDALLTPCSCDLSPSKNGD